MNSNRRSTRTLWKTLKSPFTGKWLRKIDLSSMDRAISRRAKVVGRLFAPKWLTGMFTAIQRRLSRAEKTVAKAGKFVTQAVAESPVGDGAKALAKKSKVIETQASRFILKSIAELLGALIPKPVQNFFSALGKAFWRVFGVFFVFAGRWFKTRQYWHLIGGIPAFLLALPLAYCAIRMPFYGDAAKAKHYRAAAEKAYAEHQLEAAALYNRKLTQLNAFNEQYEFLAATKEYEEGNKATGLATIKKLAGPTDNDGGFASAHLWLAKWYLQGESGETQEASREKAFAHLQRVEARDPNNPLYRLLLSQYFQQNGENGRAIDELAKIAERVPQKRLALADAYAQRGEYDKARAELTTIIDNYQNQRVQGNSLSAYEFQLWATATYLFGDAEGSQRILEEGYSSFTSDKDLRELLYSVIMNRVDTMQAEGLSGDAEIDLLKQAYQLKPEEERPLILLGQLSAVRGKSQTEAVRALDEIQKSAAKSRLNAIRGSTAAEHGDYKTAVSYLLKACEEDSQDAQSHNNLAWVYLQLGDSSLNDALELASRAIELKPSHSDYHETRGQILVRLKRPQEAIADLEFALNGMAVGTPIIHRGLAEAYTQLGQTEQAAFHRQRAH